MATFVDVSGATYPATYGGNDIHPLEGKSLVPTIRKPKTVLHDYLFGEHFDNCYVRHGDWKAVKDEKSKEWELFNIPTDRTERRNLPPGIPSSSMNSWPNGRRGPIRTKCTRRGCRNRVRGPIVRDRRTSASERRMRAAVILRPVSANGRVGHIRPVWCTKTAGLRVWKLFSTFIVWIHMKRFIISLFLLIGCSGAVSARNYALVSYNADNGLSHNTVRCIAQDQRGFMWFGTADGLNRFDGVAFRVYDSEDLRHGLLNTSVHALCADRKNRLWVGTEQGVYLYDERKDLFSSFSVRTQYGVVITGRITRIFENGDGKIWIGTEAQGFSSIIPRTARSNRTAVCPTP